MKIERNGIFEMPPMSRDTWLRIKHPQSLVIDTLQEIRDKQKEEIEILRSMEALLRELVAQ